MSAHVASTEDQAKKNLSTKKFSSYPDLPPLPHHLLTQPLHQQVTSELAHAAPAALIVPYVFFLALCLR